MIAVSPATATAATRPPQPCGGNVIVTTNVVEDQDENEPIGIADPLEKLKHSLIARPTREPTRARRI